MNDIAEKLLNKRTEMGLTLQEVSEDLEYDVSQIEAIESGNFKSFKDIFVLKCIVGDYAKYLGFDSEKIIDEFNDFIFESTSKIPLDEIQKASKTKDKTSDDKIASPYTVTEPKKNYLLIALISLTIILIIIVVCVFIYNQTVTDDNDNGLDVSIGDLYEG